MHPMPSSPAQSLPLSHLGENALQLLAQALEDTSPDRLRPLFRLIDPHQDLPGLHEVIPRLARVMPWIQLLARDPAAHFEEWGEIAGKLIRADVHQRWAAGLPRHHSARRDILNSLAGQLQQYPHYGLYTEFQGDPSGEQEGRVAPLIALFTLLAQARLISPSAAGKVSAKIRRLLNPSNRDARYLRTEFETVSFDVSSAWKVFEYARKIHPDIADFIDLAKRVATQEEKPPPRRRTPRKARLTRKQAWPMKAPAISVAPTFDAQELSGRDATDDAVEDAQVVLRIPRDSALEPTMALRTWTTFSELHNQFLHWQWAVLNPHEMATVRVSLAALLAHNDPLGMLIGLSLATARDVSDVLALRLGDPPPPSSDETPPDYWLDVAAGALLHASALPPASYVPEDEAARLALLPVADTLRILLPPALAAACRQHLPLHADGPVRLGDVLKPSADEIREAVRGWCKSIRHADPRVRVTRTRLYQWPIHRATYLSRDLAMVAHLFLLDLPGSSVLHYASFDSQRLQALHAEVMSEVFDDVVPAQDAAVIIGSRLAVQPDWLHQWIARIQQNIRAIEETRTLAGLVTCHNALASYTLALLLRWSGHRAVVDPFDAADRFDSETGTVLIADKQRGALDEARIAWLPPLAFAQLAAYQKHLRALARRIAYHDPVLAARIQRAGTPQAGVSLFFYLEIASGAPVERMVRPSKLKAALELPVPLYFGRNELSRRLRAQGVEAELVEYQLSHIQRGQDPLGLWSTLRLNDIGSILIPALEQGAQEEGWQVIAGLRASQGQPSDQPLPETNWTPGLLQRAGERSSRKREWVHEVLAVLAASPTTHWTEATVVEMAKKIRHGFPDPVKCRYAYRISRRWILRRHPEVRQAVAKHWPQVLDVPPEPARFAIDDGLLLRAYRLCRERLRAWIVTLSPRSSVAEWEGALIACALFEDAVLSDRLLAQLPLAARTSAFALENMAWIDLEDRTYSPAARRALFLTPLTGLLVMAMRHTVARRPATFEHAKQAAIDNIWPEATWKMLSDSARTGARFRLSGVEYGYAVGDLAAVSLPVTALLRLVTGRRLSNDRQLEPLPGPIRLPPPRSRSAAVKAAERDYQRAVRYHAAIRAQLHKTVIQQAQRRDPRRQLGRFLSRIARVADLGKAPPLIKALIYWLQCLLGEGRVKDRLSLRTIRDYYLAVARYLIEAGWMVQDFPALDEDELEDLYVEALTTTTWQQRPATAALMHDFHRHLRVLYRGTLAVDFHAIEPRLKGHATRSNLLTQAEYLRARQHLQLAERVALSLLYRLGLRPGELWRLTPHDLWLEGEGVLYVRSRRLATTKTPAGQRQIPLTGRLTPEELSELRHLVSRCQDDGLERLSSLMPSDTLGLITRAMREASGDYTLVPYHLRHSARTQNLMWASIDAVSVVPGAEAPSGLMTGPQQYRTIHFGAPAATRRSAYQEAVVAGHRSPATTYGTYMHLLDWLCHVAVLDDHPLADDLASHLSGLTAANVRQIRKRAGESAGTGRAVFLYRLKKGGLPSPPEWASMVEIGATLCQPPARRQRPASLIDIAHTVRLAAAGQTCDAISERLDYDQSRVSAWVATAQRVSDMSGYPMDAIASGTSPVIPALDSPGQCLSDLVCGSTPPPDWLVNWLCLWRGRYIHRLNAPYFADEDEITSWINGLVTLQVQHAQLRLGVPKNVDQHFAAVAVRAASTLGMQPSQIIKDQRSVNARSSDAARRPGIGVYLSQGPGRSSASSTLARWLYCASILVESQN